MGELDLVLVEKRAARTRKGIKRPNPKELMRVSGRVQSTRRRPVVEGLVTPETQQSNQGTAQGDSDSQRSA